MRRMNPFRILMAISLALLAAKWVSTDEFRITENDDEIKIETSTLEAAVRKRSSVTGVKAASFLDK